MYDYGITAVRRDPHSHHVTHVMWGSVDVAAPGHPCRVREACVSDVVEILLDGDSVMTLFRAEDGGWTPGADVAIARYEKGIEGIESAPSARQGHRTLADLPQF